MPDRDAPSFEDNLERFINDHPAPSGDMDLGGTGKADHSDLFAELDALHGDEPATKPVQAEFVQHMGITEAEVEAARDAADIVWDISRPVIAAKPLAIPNPASAKTYQSRYDRAFVAVRAIEARLAPLSPNDHIQRNILSRQLIDAQKRMAIELERAGQDIYRKRDGIDEWRAGTGRAERNASRREVRNTPNVTGLSVEEKAEHKRAQDRKRKAKARETSSQATKNADADQKWISRQRAKGIAEAEIASGLAKRQAKRAKTEEQNANEGRF